MPTTQTPTIHLLPIDPSTRRRVQNAIDGARALEAKARVAGLGRTDQARLANYRDILATALRQGIAR